MFLVMEPLDVDRYVVRVQVPTFIEKNFFVCLRPTKKVALWQLTAREVMPNHFKSKKDTCTELYFLPFSIRIYD